MRAVVQRVSQASVTVEGKITGRIKKGLVVLLGINRDDNRKSAEYMLDKIVNLRIFADSEDKMNLSIKDIGGEMLVVSQFTLFGDCRKGRRPSYNNAAAPEQANELYKYFVAMAKKTTIPIATGVFQAVMEVSLVNDGPVTIMLDSERCF